MQGLELAREYYKAFGAAALQENFPELEGVMAVGLAGSGSECYGFDDATSTDHDFEPGFCIWIPEEDEVDSRTAFRLERVYAKLPREFMGLKRSVMKPAGGNRHGVLRFSEFLQRHIGRRDAELTPEDWFTIPECALSEVVNGQVWRDDSGRFTAIRQQIRNMPEDVRRKKLAGSLYLMGQSGSYNYCRCIAHGESGAAQLSLAEYARHTMRVAFLLNREYMPYYKWAFRALRRLPILSELADPLEELLTTGNGPDRAERKCSLIETANQRIIDTLLALELSAEPGNDLGRQAEAVNEPIRSSALRCADLLTGAGF